MKKFLTLTLLATALPFALTLQHASAGVIIGTAIGGDAGNTLRSAAIITGVISMGAGQVIGCDRMETTYRREPVYITSPRGHRVRTSSTRRVESSQCVAWNGSSAASVLQWTGLAVLILDQELNATGDALDTSLAEQLPFIESKEVRSNLAQMIRAKAAPTFAAGHDTAIVSLTAEETREAMSELVLTDAELAYTINLLK